MLNKKHIKPTHPVEFSKHPFLSATSEVALVYLLMNRIIKEVAPMINGRDLSTFELTHLHMLMNYGEVFE